MMNRPRRSPCLLSIAILLCGSAYLLLSEMTFVSPHARSNPIRLHASTDVVAESSKLSLSSTGDAVDSGASSSGSFDPITLILQAVALFIALWFSLLLVKYRLFSCWEFPEVRPGKYGNLPQCIALDTVYLLGDLNIWEYGKETNVLFPSKLTIKFGQP
eukprot:TRINITY_DN50019_c0_g1_i1.p1 TRINITY_DN50019_c0_g1~~TRINITY_DN50019_c0_g1_i1.p1  ORF type:complete len:159 (-),score=12.08 TRINITY_DN50019_c0_g1_i1:75-551(-)